MNKYFKIPSVMIITVAMSLLVSVAFAENVATLSVSSERGSNFGDRNGVSISSAPERTSTFLVDFVSGPTEVVALQFDLIAESKNAEFDIASCGEGLPKTHFATCVVRADGSVRVLVESSTNAALVTTNIGRITLSGPARVSIKEGSVVMSDIKANAVDFEAI